jgi:hypothetical protein
MGYGLDDGPNYTHNIFYNYLSSQKQRATMFYVGSSDVDWLVDWLLEAAPRRIR